MQKNFFVGDLKATDEKSRIRIPKSADSDPYRYLVSKCHGSTTLGYPDQTLKGGFFGFFLFMYDIQHCFICHPSDSTVSEDAGIEPRTVATTALAVRRSNHSARSHPDILFHVIYLIRIGGGNSAPLTRSLTYWSCRLTTTSWTRT
jgi:hypothetical protein